MGDVLQDKQHNLPGNSMEYINTCEFGCTSNQATVRVCSSQEEDIWFLQKSSPHLVQSFPQMLTYMIYGWAEKMASFLGPHGELKRSFILFHIFWCQLDDEHFGVNSPPKPQSIWWVSTWEWISWGPGSFLADHLLFGTSKGRNPKGFLTTGGQWSQDSWENIGNFLFLSWSCLASVSRDLWRTRNVCCKAPKHTMAWVFWRHQKGSSWGFTNTFYIHFSCVSVTIYNLALIPSTSFIAPKLVVVQPNKPLPSLEATQPWPVKSAQVLKVPARFLLLVCRVFLHNILPVFAATFLGVWRVGGSKG